MEYLDKPLLDETPGAHPAYWRGKARGINDILKIVSDIMLGHDDGSGVNNHAGVESMRRALLTWRGEVDNSMDNKSTKRVDKQ
jgi:hypothetical protein